MQLFKCVLRLVAITTIAQITQITTIAAIIMLSTFTIQLTKLRTAVKQVEAKG